MQDLPGNNIRKQEPPEEPRPSTTTKGPRASMPKAPAIGMVAESMGTRQEGPDLDARQKAQAGAKTKPQLK